MADNTTASGVLVGTDEVDSVHYQRMKVVHGADGSVIDASAANPFPVDQVTLIAGERNVGTGNDYLLTRDGSNLTIIGIQTAVTIGAGSANDTRLHGIKISAALVGTCVITGFADSAGAATSITLPVGSNGFHSFGNAINSAGALTVTCSNAADDNSVQVIWSAV